MGRDGDGGGWVRIKNAHVWWMVSCYTGRGRSRLYESNHTRCITYLKWFQWQFWWKRNEAEADDHAEFEERSVRDRWWRASVTSKPCRSETTSAPECCRQTFLRYDYSSADRETGLRRGIALRRAASRRSKWKLRPLRQGRVVGD